MIICLLRSLWAAGHESKLAVTMRWPSGENAKLVQFVQSSTNLRFKVVAQKWHSAQILV